MKQEVKEGIEKLTGETKSNDISETKVWSDSGKFHCEWCWKERENKDLPCAKIVQEVS